jgi:phage shock protein PspC (stress-responsive transcriptional regulator)
MTKSNDAPGQGHGLDGLYTALRRPGIVRQSNGRWFAGVAAGVARWLGVDPLVVRAGFILLSLFFGMGVALYLVVWLLMPDEQGTLRIESALKYGDGSSIFLLIVTALSLFGGGPWWRNDFNGFRVVGLIAVVAAAWWFVTQTDTGRGLLRPGSDRSTASPTAPETSRSTGNAAAQAGASLAAPSTAPFAAPGAAPITTPSTAPFITPSDPPAATTVPAPSPAAYAAPRTRTPAIGFAGGLLVLGLAAVTGAVLMSLGLGTDSHLGVPFAGALGMLGLGLVIAGLAGRKAGWLTGFAVLGIAATLLTMAVPKGLTMPFRVGDTRAVVTTLTGDNNYQVGLGQLYVDLTGAKYQDTSGTDVVRATVGAGQLHLILPEGVPVTVHASGWAGDLVALGGNNTSSRIMQPGNTTPMNQFERNGTNWSETVTYGSGTGPAEIEVYAEVGAGQIKITTGSTP